MHHACHDLAALLSGRISRRARETEKVINSFKSIKRNFALKNPIRSLNDPIYVNAPHRLENARATALHSQTVLTETAPCCSAENPLAPGVAAQTATGPGLCGQTARGRAAFGKERDLLVRQMGPNLRSHKILSRSHSFLHPRAAPPQPSLPPLRSRKLAAGAQKQTKHFPCKDTERRQSAQCRSSVSVEIDFILRQLLSDKRGFWCAPLHPSLSRLPKTIKTIASMNCFTCDRIRVLPPPCAGNQS